MSFLKKRISDTLTIYCDAPYLADIGACGAKQQRGSLNESRQFKSHSRKGIKPETWYQLSHAISVGALRSVPKTDKGGKANGGLALLCRRSMVVRARAGDVVINLAAPPTAAMEAVQATPMAQDLFNYASLDPAHADEARRTAELIRRRLLSSYIDTGADLIEIKDKIGHGAFGAWVKAEFCFTERTAENFMNAARLAREYEIISELPPTIVYLLAAPSAPAAFVADVLAEAKKGIIPRVREIKTRLAEAIKAQRRADIDAAERPELVKIREEGPKAEASALVAAQSVAQFLFDHLGASGSNLTLGALFSRRR